MNDAERLRDLRIRALDDFALLGLLVAEPRDELISEHNFGVFRDMLQRLKRGEVTHLSRAQRSWAEDIARQIVPLRTEEAPRGHEVPTPAVLQNLPKRPPGRRGAP